MEVIKLIITNKQQQWMYNKMDDMKSVSKFNLDKKVWQNWCHTTNHINSLELDQNIVGGKFQLGKYKVDNMFTPLILPYQITFNGDVREANLLDEQYANYDDNSMNYGYSPKVKILSPEDYNDVSDVILAAFKKTANFTTLDTLKSTDALSGWYKREAHGDSTSSIPDGATGWVPVNFKVNIKKPRYMNEEANFVFEDWFSANLRTLKGGARQQQPTPGSGKDDKSE